MQNKEKSPTSGVSRISQRGWDKRWGKAYSRMLSCSGATEKYGKKIRRKLSPPKYATVPNCSNCFRQKSLAKV